ncbi:phage terminase large subunit family protein [Acinetobacter sp. YH1901141]|uniref:phage terminase large subunit family protein n=1 Tax=Acinetobacter sp. YH1901141 TaxID=2601201 RepID=UPI001C554AD2|nr:phage terminase large subunit family protein [Acinetobacter sp. YH1901141]
MMMFSNMNAVYSAMQRSMQNLLPPPDLKPSDWAEKNIKIPVGNAIPGPINFDNAPYQRGMIDAIKERGVRRISYMTGAQLGKTTVQQCATSYFIAHEPRSQIFVQPTQGDVQTFLETKLRPMLESNPEIARKMAKPRSRDGVNNSRMISYIGGWLLFSWAGSPKTLRGRSAPVTHADEVDGMEATAEGDPVELLSQRAATFGDQALRTESSTPTVAGASRIENAFNEGDRRRYYVPCPHCSEAQFLKWENVTWEGRKSSNIQDAREDLDQEHHPETAGYRCECCGQVWTDGERIAAIRNAEKLGHGWKAEKPFRGHISFHAPEMLSTFRKMRDIVQSYLDKLALDDLQVFVNVSLGETYEEKGDKADPETLQNRAEEYKSTVPNGGVYLTCGIDMQMDRLELEIVAWGAGEESWSIDYRVLWGDPLGEEVWEDLDDILESTYLHESGAQLSISASCLDTGGTAGYTQRAYEYVKSRRNRKLFAIKGRGGWGMPIVQSPQRKQSGKDKRKIDLFIVGTDEAKLVVMRRLDLDKQGPGYCHFPIERETEWYRQLTAEKLVTRYIKGQPIREWHKPDRARNEGLDCRVYALAALKIMQPNLKRIAERVAMGGDSIRTVQSDEPVKSSSTIIRKKAKVTETNVDAVQPTTIIKKRKVFGNKK